MTSNKNKSNHKQYFIYGVGLLIAGILLTMKFKFECVFILYGTGITYLIIGLVRRKKWNAFQNERISP